jgi:hypothetical protein
MPAARRVTATTELAVGTPNSDNYREAQSHVTAEMSIKDTVEHPRFLGTMTDKEKREIRAVLRAVPPDVDRAYMASLRDALDRNAKIEFEWQNGDFAHQARTVGDTVHLVLVTPDGRNFTGVRGFMRSLGIKRFPRPI